MKGGAGFLSWRWTCIDTKKMTGLMIGMGGELVEGGWATAEMQISRWPAAGDQIPSPGGRTLPCISSVQLDYLVNRYILHSAH